MAAGDFEQASSLYAGLARQGDPELVRLQGLAEAAAGRPLSGARILEALPEGARDRAVQEVMIRAQLYRGEVEPALAAARALSEEDPSDVAALVLLGDALSASGAKEEASRAYHLALGNGPSADAWIGLGDLVWADGRADLAEVPYNQALKVGGDRMEGVTARARLVRLMAATGRGMEAELLLQEALTLRPNHPDAAAEFGKHLLRSGYAEEALLPLQDAQRDLGEDPEILATLGVAFLQRARMQPSVNQRVRDLQAAQMWLERAVARDPSRADAYNDLGQVKTLLGDRMGAEAAFQRAFEAAPGQIESLLNLGRLYAEEGHVALARAALERALTVAPRSVILQMNLGVLSLREGQDDDAASWFGKAAATCAASDPSHPCHPELAYNQARLAGRRGDAEASAASLLEAFSYGFGDVGRIEAEPELEAARGDIRVAAQMDALRLRISN